MSRHQKLALIIGLTAYILSGVLAFGHFAATNMEKNKAILIVNASGCFFFSPLYWSYLYYVGPEK